MAVAPFLPETLAMILLRADCLARPGNPAAEPGKSSNWDKQAQIRIAHGRSGFSLMEMLVAAAILLASVVLLSQLADVGTRHARQAESLANAQRICQNVLNEILAGAAPLEPLKDMPLLDEPGWSYSVAFEPLALPLRSPRLGILRVTVTEQSAGPQLPVQFTLWRFVRAPATLEPQSDYLLGQ
jgi:prepilin-type N-terminal cleavage/methylation domain-containing protein